MVWRSAIVRDIRTKILASSRLCLSNALSQEAMRKYTKRKGGWLQLHLSRRNIASRTPTSGCGARPDSKNCHFRGLKKKKLWRMFSSKSDEFNNCDWNRKTRFHYFSVPTIASLRTKSSASLTRLLTKPEGVSALAKRRRSTRAKH